MKFIVDTQLPPKLASLIREKGFDCIHTTHFDDGHLLTDNQIVVIAIAEERTVISKDADFLEHYRIKGTPPKVLLLNFGNISNSNLFTYFEAHFTEIVRLFREGAELVAFDRKGIVVND